LKQGIKHNFPEPKQIVVKTENFLVICELRETLLRVELHQRLCWHAAAPSNAESQIGAVSFHNQVLHQINTTLHKPRSLKF